MRHRFAATLAAALTFTTPALHAADMITDNSFLIEEAYNQEPGTVQFINGYQFSDLTNESTYTFTNEFPAPDETHQLSYSIPVSKKAGPPTETGVGDVLLNYRYQLVSNKYVAMAPRFSVILPTGDYKKGMGNGATGFQFNQSVSLTLNEQWQNHWNAGFTYTPDAKNTTGDKASLFGFNFGTSVVYQWTESFNLLCEFVLNNTETVTGPDAKSSASTYYVLPGFRTSFKVGKDTEIVPGLAALLGAGPSATSHERGLFAYLSIESKLW
jgi:hypothetical protein